MKVKKILCGMVPVIAMAGLSQAGVILSADYLSPTYADGQLAYQNGWQLQTIAQVDSTLGTVSSVGGPFDRNAHGSGARGGVGGVPEPSGGFEQYDELKITFYYSFIMAGEGNTAFARFGIRGEGPNAGNGFEASPEQGCRIEYNAFDPDPGTVDDGNVKFYPNFNSPTANSNALIIEGLDAGIDPGNSDFASDVLKIEYVLGHDGAGNFSLSSFTVTNQTTMTSYTYGGDPQSFVWSSTDAFFAQQLAYNGNAGFTGTSSGVIFEYTPAPAVRPFVTIDYTAAEGYGPGSLEFQNGWYGSSSTVDETGSGTVTSGGFLRNLYGNGLRGGVAGVPVTTGDFTTGESIRVIFDYQFTLEGNLNDGLAKVGFADEGPNAGNGWSSNPQEGFKIDFNTFDPAKGGGVKFFPDSNDSANADALIIDGNDLGIDPATTADFVSDQLRIFYTLGIVGDGTWSVDNFVVANLDTGAAWCYSGDPQTIPWSTSLKDAFFAQQLTRTSRTTTATTDRVQIDFLAVPDPQATPVIAIDYTYEECYSTGTDNLSGQNGWLGQAFADVDASGSGSASSIGGPFDRNLYGNGIRGGTAGVGNAVGDFSVGETIEVEFDYQFTLSGDFNRELVNAGFRDGIAGDASPQEGFKIKFSIWDPDGSGQTDGNVQFFPDLNNSAAVANALALEGVEVGVDPANAVPDLVSDRLRIHYTVSMTAADTFTVDSFIVENRDTGSTYAYTGPTQDFTWAATDAFWAQQLALNGDAGFTGTTDGVAVRYVQPADVPIEIVSVTPVAGNLLEVQFIGAANAGYKLTESPDLEAAFTDTGESTTTNGAGEGTLEGSMSGADAFFFRVEEAP